MEAWLKFRAPGVSLEIGLSIGQLIFKALNKVEWGFAIVLFSILLFNVNVIPFYSLGVTGIPLFILFLQTVFLFPRLSDLAQKKVQGISTPKSSIHIYYVIFELIKVIVLIGIGC